MLNVITKTIKYFENYYHDDSFLKFLFSYFYYITIYFLNETNKHNNKFIYNNNVTS